MSNYSQFTEEQKKHKADKARTRLEKQSLETPEERRIDKEVNNA